MSPIPGAQRRWTQGEVVPKPTDPEELILEAWAQGYNVGSLIVLILIVFCNYRSGIWLHKLILLEVSFMDAAARCYCFWVVA